MSHAGSSEPKSFWRRPRPPGQACSSLPGNFKRAPMPVWSDGHERRQHASQFMPRVRVVPTSDTHYYKATACSPSSTTSEDEDEEVCLFLGAREGGHRGRGSPTTPAAAVDSSRPKPRSPGAPSPLLTASPGRTNGGEQKREIPRSPMRLYSVIGQQAAHPSSSRGTSPRVRDEGGVSPAGDETPGALQAQCVSCVPIKKDVPKVSTVSATPWRASHCNPARRKIAQSSRILPPQCVDVIAESANGTSSPARIDNAPLSAEFSFPSNGALSSSTHPYERSGAKPKHLNQAQKCDRDPKQGHRAFGRSALLPRATRECIHCKTATGGLDKHCVSCGKLAPLSRTFPAEDTGVNPMGGNKKQAVLSLTGRPTLQRRLDYLHGLPLTSGAQWVQATCSRYPRGRRNSVDEGVLVYEVDEGQPCLNCKDKCPGFSPHLWRKVCNNCKCPREAHDVYHEEFVNVRDRIGIKADPSNHISKEKTLREGYSWVPPGLPSSKIEEYFAQLPNHKVPRLGTPGEKYRDKQLIVQLPKQDLALAYCKFLEKEYHKSFEDFVNLRNEIALDIGYVRDALDATLT